MNSYIVTITSSAAVIDEIERKIRELYPKDCTDTHVLKREKPETIEFTPPFIDLDDEDIEIISAKYPDETVNLHYCASLGCSYHVIESVFSGGKMTVTRDETEDIC
ncbi:MAG: hypothetical protein J6X52_02295 [Clostridia bacterium]|nr:hypothetical protein [Clostridia bacterium]